MDGYDFENFMMAFEEIFPKGKISEGMRREWKELLRNFSFADSVKAIKIHIGKSNTTPGVSDLIKILESSKKIYQDFSEERFTSQEYEDYNLKKGLVKIYTFIGEKRVYSFERKEHCFENENGEWELRIR